ncbi:probable ATP-dependent RNA helicase DDX10 [Neodiprion virginianus]|uniref:probable ATP-dependent RNA helicase DDX10 n=1 Tax=Neodiprion virginianus TaxID=2961670 RepID=UPI001EE76EDB|nr:probable ATP-dependent RNA helicase DDX10 [Neodiprion virginianus]
MSNKGTKKKVKIYHKKKYEPEEKIIEKLQAAYKTVDISKVKTFSDLPLSQRTLRGLKVNEFLEPTEIQRQSIALALRGLDILGAAKTGSGKTLAFLIPILEILYCKQWTRLDAVGALVITPTRELAYQIYETLRKVGCYHDFSAGLIIGGKDLHFEKKRMHQCNIVICTPGRLLQHMDENPLFDCVNMQVLVLDEADRCLDMGFEQTMNSIIENLPSQRQTLLFSATQTKSVKDLARLSLHDPMYVSVHEHATHKTPERLQQSYVVCNLEDKMSMLWSFVRNHLRQKILVFFSSCKQVKYVNDMFCRLKPGVSLLALYGTLHQLKRMAIYEAFCKKQHAVLFATDIAARGLDFPAVNWVVQMDCPEDVNAYIHRAGRTARFQRGGESLLVLLPSEINMIEQLQEHKVPINVIKINPNKLQSPHRKMEALLARDVALKETAQRAFVAYVKSVFLMKDKSIFDVHQLNTDAYAKSLGLAIPPRIRFLQKINKAKENVRAKKLSKLTDSTNSEISQKLSNYNIESDSDSDKGSGNSASGNEPRENSDNEYHAVDSRDRRDTFFGNEDSDSDENILTVKRRDIDIQDDNDSLNDHTEDEYTENIDNTNTAKKKAVTKAALAKKILKKKIVANKKTTFDDEGQVIVNPTKSKMSERAREYENEESSGIDIEKAKAILREEDRFDKERFKERIRAKHREEKQKLKASRKKVHEEVEQEGEDAEDEGDSDGSSDENEPDLSWLPDPDKIYGKREDTDAIQFDNASEDTDEIDRIPKRKLLDNEEINGKKNRKKAKLCDKNVGLSLLEDEELALQLLKNRFIK